MRSSLGLLALVAFAFTSAVAQDVPPQSITYGVAVAFASGHADRGFLMTDRPVLQPVTWLTWSRAELSVWSNLPLEQSGEGTRPQVVELELWREHHWGKLMIGPAVRMFFYHDVLNREHDRSLEGWLYLSYDIGPVSLFANHSLDVLNYKGAYFVDAGIESEHAVSPHFKLGALAGAGWGFAKFNYAYAGVAQRALDRVTAEAWLRASAKSFYVAPHVEYSSIVDRALRAEVFRPTYVLIRLTFGAEF